jgi:hypothetical protein
LNDQVDTMNGDALQVGLQNFMVHVSAKAGMAMGDAHVR